jgi:hypothetical protein
MESMEFEVRNQYGEVVSEGLTLDQARETAKEYAEDYACDEIYDEPFTVVMCVPLETYTIARPEPTPVVCTCVTARTCVVGMKG